MSEQILFIGVGLAVGMVLAWFFLKRENGEGSNDVMTQQFARLEEVMDRRLRENVTAMNESKNFLAHRVSAAEQSVRSVSQGLGKLEQATSSLARTTEEIASFQQMLKSPKVRGSFGEVLLSNLLSDVLPADRFALQYQFPSSGEIADSIIRLLDGYIVAVDAKFPFANYELYSNEKDEHRKKQLRVSFLRDVKKHINDISKKYISPHEKTLDYAFMYIPIEGVYYETIVRDEGDAGVWEFCLKNKVIPVSPNSFLAYLHTVLIGLRGMQIEQQAKEILQHLGQLRHDFGRFSEDFATVGTHLTNAKNRYDDSTRRLDKFSNRLEQIESSSATPQLPEGE